MKKKLIAATLFVSMLSTAWASGLPEPLSKEWAATQLPVSAASIYIKEIGSHGEPLLSVNADELKNPASVMKLVTTYAALQQLGPAWSWQTKFVTEQANITETLTQPLYLVSSGDPTISTQDLWNMLQDLRLQGVVHIPRLIVDRSVYGDVNIDTFAFDGQGTRPYNASPDPWIVAQGSMRINISPDYDKKVWEVKTLPNIPTIKIEGQPLWEEGECPSRSPSVPVEATHYQEYSVVTLSGSLKSGCGEVDLYRVFLHQAVYASDTLRQIWTDMGGTIGAIEYGDTPSSATTVLVQHNSPTLPEVVRVINKESNNLMARQLMLSVGVDMNGRGVTTETAAQAIKQVLAINKVDVPGLVIENGSGLSRVARISAHGLANILNAAWLSPTMPEFVSSLSIAGMDGTFRRRYETNDLVKGVARLKSGTLRDVRALAGYVRSQSGRQFIVISLINDEKASSANAFNDKLVEWVVQQ